MTPEVDLSSELADARRQHTRRGLDDVIAVEAQGELLVKGKTEPVKAYAVRVDSLVAESV